MNIEHREQIRLSLQAQSAEMRLYAFPRHNSDIHAHLRSVVFL